MKKLLAALLLAGSAAVLTPAAEAKPATDSQRSITSYSSEPQVWNRGRRWNRNRRVRVVTTTRTRRIGYRVYRETVRITYLPNGRMRTQVIRRVRIR